MIAFLARVTGIWLIAGALVALVVDATRSIAASSISVTPLGATWFALTPTNLVNTQQFVQREVEAYIGQWLWDPVIQWLLLLPTWSVLGVLGFALAYLGRRRRARAAYV